MSASPATLHAFPTNLATALWLKLHRESWHFLFPVELLKRDIVLKGKLGKYYNAENITSIFLNHNYATVPAKTQADPQ